jgi:hypothetical protein
MKNKLIYLCLIGFIGISNLLMSCSQTNKINYKEVDKERVEALNKEISEQGITNIEEIANLYSPKDLYAEGNYSYEVTLTEDQPNYELKIKEEGVMDDSLDGVLSIISIKKVGNDLKVTNIKQAFKCKKDRGQQEWGPEFCN